MPNEPYSDGYLVTYDNVYGQTIGQSNVIDNEPTEYWLQGSLAGQTIGGDPVFTATTVTVVWLQYDEFDNVLNSQVTQHVY